MFRVSAILGAVVADAASLPLDWIYDDAKMKVHTLWGGITQIDIPHPPAPDMMVLSWVFLK